MYGVGWFQCPKCNTRVGCDIDVYQVEIEGKEIDEYSPFAKEKKVSYKWTVPDDGRFEKEGNIVRLRNKRRIDSYGEPKIIKTVLCDKINYKSIKVVEEKTKSGLLLKCPTCGFVLMKISSNKI